MANLGSGLAGLVPVAMMLVGVVSILRARRARRRGVDPATPADKDRQAAAMEMERRMASYLAQRDGGN